MNFVLHFCNLHQAGNIIKSVLVLSIKTTSYTVNSPTSSDYKVLYITTANH